MAEDLGGRATTRPVLLVPMVLLLGALTYATEAQGAFYPGPFHVFVVLVGAALVSAVVITPSTWTRQVVADPLVVTVAGLALVTVVSSVVAGHAADAVGTVTLFLTMAAAVAVVKTLGPEQRRLLTAGVVLLAVVVAVIGWAAVVARWQPEALTSQGLWRAASTLTYENALAAFLTAPALLCFDRLLCTDPVRTDRPGTEPAGNLVWSEASFLLLVGTGASLSRGGFLGLAVGVGVLGILRGPRNLPRLGPPLLGSMVALACLAPGAPVASSTHAVLAYVGLAFGGALAAWTSGGRRQRLGTAVAAAAVLGVAIAFVSSGHVAGAIVHARASATSSDRAHEWAAAADVARHHLLLGVGTARVLLQWTVGGQVFTASFAHNEYLQLLIQDGIAGLAVLLIGLVCVVVRLSRLRGRDTAWSAECGIACLVALLVQSALDFLWHVPVIPVLMAAVLALSTTATPPSKRGRRRPPVLSSRPVLFSRSVPRPRA